MGHVRCPITISRLSGEEEIEMEAMVDTGSTYTWVPRPILQRLGIEPTESREFILANGSVITREIAPARLRFSGRQVFVHCVFADEDTVPLLGVVALEEAGLAVDPVIQSLVPTRGYAL